MELPLRYIPWTSVKSWECLACGECCSQFNIPLRAKEYVKIRELFGDYAIEIKFGRAYIRKQNGRCIFQGKRLCMLQSLGVKPLSCRIYPFAVRTKVKKEDKRAIFPYKGRKFYVYVNQGCRGLVLGEPDEHLILEVIPEAIELSLNPETQQKWLTSQLPRYVGLPAPSYIYTRNYPLFSRKPTFNRFHHSSWIEHSSHTCSSRSPQFGQKGFPQLMHV
jgi:hypothetical protein